MILEGVTITGGVLVESAGIVPVDNAFRMTIDTTNNLTFEFGLGESVSNPLVGGTIDWGDGNTTVFSNINQSYNHTYSSANTYNVSVSGYTETFVITANDILLSVDSFGNIGLTGYFSLADSFILSNVPSVLPNTISNLSYLFSYCSSLNDANVSLWDTQNIIDAESMFEGCTAFNQDLTGWCVTNMPTEPTNFALDSALDANNYPVWGTCP